MILEIISDDGSELKLTLIHLSVEQKSRLYIKSSNFIFTYKDDLIISVKTVTLKKRGKNKNFAT